MQSPMCHETIKCRTVKSTTYRRYGRRRFGWYGSRGIGLYGLRHSLLHTKKRTKKP